MARKCARAVAGGKRKEESGARKETERCGYERRAFVAHQHSKYSVGRRARLFTAEEGQKPPERGGCCINIYMRKEGLLCAEGRKDAAAEGSGGGKVEMKCKCLNELLRDYRGTS